VKTWFMSIGGIHTMEVPLTTEAVKGGSGSSIEVALVLDNTGSMSADIGALRDAANSFVDTVIADQQTPFYSKASVIPYAEGVNLPTALRNAARMNDNTLGCNWYGCTTYHYWSPSNSGWWNKARTNCATERSGLEAFTDASVSANLVNTHYQTCLAAAVQPLTSNRTTLHNTINAMTANGGTAGQVGIQWGWYTLAPSSGVSEAIGDANAKGAAYGAAKVKKIMIIMTDGEFNTSFCNGVYAKETGYSGRENCNSPNGNSNDQAIQLCNNMKVANKNIELYFVGFDLVNTALVNNLKTACSTDAAHVINAADQAGLRAAFAQIAANLQSMRLSM
jgi:hypothetical protein